MSWDMNGRNQRAEATAGLIDEVSLHTADPGTGATNEWSGGGYSRQSPNFGAAADGATNAATLNFTGPPATNAAWMAFWDSGGQRLAKAQRTSGDAASNAAGEYNVTTLRVTATGAIST